MSDKRGEILYKIHTGEYKLVRNNHRKSTIWVMFDVILEKDNKTLVEGFVHCSSCRKVLAYYGKSSSNLRRHTCFARWLRKNDLENGIMMRRRKKEKNQSLLNTDYEDVDDETMGNDSDLLNEVTMENDDMEEFVTEENNVEDIDHDVMKELVNKGIVLHKIKQEEIFLEDTALTTNNEFQVGSNLEAKDETQFTATTKKILIVDPLKNSNYNGPSTSGFVVHEVKDMKGENKNEILKMCLNWLIEDSQPLDTIDGSGFKKFFAFTLKMGSKYGERLAIENALPTPLDLKTHLQQMAEMETREMANLKTNKNYGFSISLYVWSDLNTKKYFIKISLHYIKDIQLCKIVLGVISLPFDEYNSETLRDHLDGYLEKFNLNPTGNVNLIWVTNKQEDVLNEPQSKQTILPCSTTLFRQVLDAAIGLCPKLVDIIKILRKIKEHLKLSSGDSSDYDLLKSINENWKVIENMTQNELDTLGITTKIFEIMQSLNDLIEKFEIIFKALQDHHMPSLYFILPSINRLKALCETSQNDSNEIGDFKSQVLKFVTEIWLPSLSIYHKAAFFLYPPANREQANDLDDIKEFCLHKMKDIKENSQQTSSTADSKIVETKTSKEIDFFFSDLLKCSSSLDPLEEEFRLYCLENVIIHDSFNVCQWWHNNSSKYPILSQLALQLMTIPASSRGSECLSKLHSQIIENPEICSNILFLNSLQRNKM